MISFVKENYADDSHPLWNAVQNFDRMTLKTLARDGVDFHTRFINDVNFTVLERAVQQAPLNPSALKRVHLLLELGIDLNIHTNVLKFLVAETWNPLPSDKQSIVLSLLDDLIQAGLDIQQRDMFDRTVICILGMKRQFVVKKLITCGIDIDKTDEYGFNPLIYSLLSQDFETASLLLQNNVYIHARPWCALPYQNGKIWENKSASEIASLLSKTGFIPKDIVDKISELEGRQTPSPAPALKQGSAQDIETLLSSHEGKLYWFEYLDWNNETYNYQYAYPCVLCPYEILSIEQKEKFKPGIKGMSPYFLPFGFVLNPKYKYDRKSFPADLSSRIVWGIIGLDISLKPDDRRPVHTGPWSNFNYMGKRLALHSDHFPFLVRTDKK